MIRALVFVLWIVLFFALSCAPVLPPAASEPEEPLVKPEEVVISEYSIGAGDVLEVSVYRQKELDAKVLIPPDGTLFLPLIGEVETRGLGLRRLRKKLTERYSEYLFKPVVSLKLQAIRSRKAFVLGEVRAPGLITLEMQVDVVEAIARAGGFTLDGKLDSVLLIRGDLKKPEIKRLDIEKALTEADLTQNLIVRSGDIVFVPRTFIADVDRFFRHFAKDLPGQNWSRSYVMIWILKEEGRSCHRRNTLRRKSSSISEPLKLSESKGQVSNRQPGRSV